MKFNIYIANHGKRDGIEDFLTILVDVVQKRGHEVTISEELQPDTVNLIIDEFTSALSNREIEEFKQDYPAATLIYVLTEFIEHKWFVASFNFFGNPLDAAAIAAMNVYFRLRRKDFNAPSHRDWLMATAYSPFLVLYVLSHLVTNLSPGKHRRMSLRKRLYRTAYMLMRYLGLERMIAYADGVILSHDHIESGLRRIAGEVRIAGTIYPELNFTEIKKNLFQNKQLFIEITGSVTPYRKRFIREIDNDILALGLKSRFQDCRAISFFSEEPIMARGAYSLHPPQTRTWKYSSPTRIFRALQYDYSVPILTRIFDQHPIEKLCLQFRGDETLIDLCQHYKHPERLIEYLEPLATGYMEIAKERNDAAIKAIIPGRELN